MVLEQLGIIHMVKDKDCSSPHTKHKSKSQWLTEKNLIEKAKITKLLQENI